MSRLAHLATLEIAHLVPADKLNAALQGLVNQGILAGFKYQDKYRDVYVPDATPPTEVHKLPTVQDEAATALFEQRLPIAKKAYQAFLQAKNHTPVKEDEWETAENGLLIYYTLEDKKGADRHSFVALFEGLKIILKTGDEPAKVTT